MKKARKQEKKQARRILFAAVAVFGIVLLAEGGKVILKDKLKKELKASSTETESVQQTEQMSDMSREEEAFTVVKEYGFSEDGYSNLSYLFRADTLKDCGDYYEMSAYFEKPICIPPNLSAGESYTITTNELTGETSVITVMEDGRLVGDDEMEYYCYAGEDTSGQIVLYQGSDDRVDAIFYEGVVRISKEAVSGAAILNEPYEQIDEGDLRGEEGEDVWYNGVKFDENGMITELIFFGD